MPLYEYRCENCGERFEVIQKFSDQPLAVHEKCGGSVQRLISAPALQFKGSGWYITDYARGSNTAANTANNGESKKADAPASTTASSDSGANSSPSSDKSSSSSDTK